MKTKTKLTLLAFAAISFNTIRAEELLVDTDGDGYADSPVKLCGGADDDQKAGPRPSGSICGAMDDDQIVGGDGADFLRPNTANFSFGANQTGGSLTSVQYPYKVAEPSAPSMTTDGGGWTLLTSNGSTAGLYTSVQAPYQLQGPQTNGFLTSVQYPYTLIAGGNGNDTFSPPVNRGLVGDPLSIRSGNGNDTLVAGAGMGAGPAGIIVGGVGIDYVCSAGTTAITGTGPGGAPHITGDAGDDIRTDRQILQLMTTGSLHGDDDSDPLRGYSGGDELIYGETGSDSLYGGNGADTTRPAPTANGFVFGTTGYGFVFGTTSY